MKHAESLAIAMIAFFMCIAIVPNVSAAISVSVSQSGADSDEVMNDNTFIVEATGWTGDCSQATISLSGCPSCSLSGEDTVKSIGGGATSISWTTVSASQKASAQTISVSVSSGCTLQQASSSSFDIVLPPSLSLSASTATTSLAAGGSFNTNLNVVNNGETTANSVSIAVSGTGMSASCDSISSIDEGQSAAETCLVTASSAGSQTVTFTASATNADSDSDSFTITVSGGGGDDDDGNGGGSPGGGPGPDQNKSSRPTLVPGVGLRNNTKLQAAIEKVLAKGKMSEQAKENLLRLSESITSDISTTRWFNVSGGKSRITTRFRYTGQNRIRNLIAYESVPKTFAADESLITVNAPGGTVEVAEDDPSWVIMYSEVDPNDEIIITYEVAGSRNSGVIDDMKTEIYAESVEEADTGAGQVSCSAGEKRCSGSDMQQCSAQGDAWETVEKCQYGCDAATLQCNTEPGAGPAGGSEGEFPWLWIIIIIIVVVVVVFLIKKRSEYQ